MTSTDSNPALPNESGEESESVYLTDGRRLFRLVRAFSPPAGRVADLEDCFTLVVHACTAEELWEMRLRTVPHAATTAG